MILPYGLVHATQSCRANLVPSMQRRAFVSPLREESEASARAWDSCAHKHRVRAKEYLLSFAHD